MDESWWSGDVGDPIDAYEDAVRGQGEASGEDEESDEEFGYV
jgi:hypothetical protein